MTDHQHSPEHPHRYTPGSSTICCTTAELPAELARIFPYADREVRHYAAYIVRRANAHIGDWIGHDTYLELDFHIIA